MSERTPVRRLNIGGGVKERDDGSILITGNGEEEDLTRPGARNQVIKSSSGYRWITESNPDEFDDEDDYEQGTEYLPLTNALGQLIHPARP